MKGTITVCIVILHIEDHTYMYIVKYKMVHKNQNFDINKLAPKISLCSDYKRK